MLLALILCARFSMSVLEQLVLRGVNTVCFLLTLCFSSFFFQVFNAYQAGVGALKLSMKDVTVEKAENLVDQIQEVLK